MIGSIIALIRELSYDIPFFKYFVWIILALLPQKVFEWLQREDIKHQFGG